MAAQSFFTVGTEVDYLALTCVVCGQDSGQVRHLDVPMGGSYEFRCMNEECKNNNAIRLKVPLDWPAWPGAE